MSASQKAHMLRGVPASIFVMCIEAAVITMSLGILLTAIHLVAVVAGIGLPRTPHEEGNRK